MRAISQATIEDVISGKLTYRIGQSASRVLGSDLAAPVQLSGALRSLGYNSLDTPGLDAKRGLWTVFVREHPIVQNGSNHSGSAVAFYADRSNQEVGYLFMSKPDSEPKLEEIAHNAQVITSGLLEKSPSGKQIVLRAAAVGAVLTGIGLETLTLFGIVNEPSLPARVAVDFGAAYAGGFLVGFVSGLFLGGYDDTLSRKYAAKLSNPDSYIYGRTAAIAIKADLAYTNLRASGAQVDRPAFNAALSLAGVNVPT